jgi:hypothetical protein
MKGTQMARKVLHFTKNKTLAIQGICTAGGRGVTLGDVCDGSDRHGGGFVGDMEVQGQVIVIRKVDKDGKPHRDYGKVAASPQQPLQSIRLDNADGVLWPLIMAEAVVFVDEPDQKKATAKQEPEPKKEPPAK